MLFWLFACAGSPADSGVDTADSTEHTDDTDGDFNCDFNRDSPEIRVNGEDPPSVGTEWDVFLWCGDVLMTGAMHISIDPPELAVIEDYQLTFVADGDGLLEVQVGSIRAERAVTVSPGASK